MAVIETPYPKRQKMTRKITPYFTLLLLPFFITAARGEEPFKDIFEAADKGTVADVRFFLEQGVDVRTKNDRQEDTPLHRAASRNPDVEVVKFLVEQGADIHAKNKFGDTPLHYATGNSNIDVLKFLVEQGADVNVKNNLKRPPLENAMHHPEHMKVLVEHGADVNATGMSDEPLLYWTARGTPDAEVVRYLIEQGADVNVVYTGVTKERRTPLDVANREAKREILRAAGGRREIPFLNLTEALRKGPPDDIRRFLDEETDVPVKPDGMFFFAARYNTNVEAIKTLIELGANIHAGNGNGQTPLHVIIRYNPEPDEIAKFLVELGADIHARDNNGTTPLLFAAARNNDNGLVKFLLERNADIHARDKNGATSLHYAVLHYPKVERRAGIIKTLVEHGAYINAKDNHGMTPIFHAINLDNQGDVLNTGFYLLKSLVENGADVNVKDKNRRTPLDLARKENARTLIRNAGGMEGIRNIFDAAARGNADDIRFYLHQMESYYDEDYYYNDDAELWNDSMGVNIKDRTGATLLHLAAEKNPDIAVLKFLLEKGADVNATDTEGKTPLDGADTEEKRTILRDAGGEPGQTVTKPASN